MARNEARLFTAIWKDPDFVALPQDAQWMYMFLLSQDDLTYCGVIPLRPARWARKASGLTVADVECAIAALASGPRPLVVADEEAGELLVRSLIRHDGIWKQPNIMKAARESATVVESPAIRSALRAELERVPAAESPSEAVREAHAEFLADLRDTPPAPSAIPARAPAPASPVPDGPHAADGAPPRRQDAGPDRPGTPGRTKAQATMHLNPSRKGSPNPSAGPSQGEGVRPLSPFPETPPPPPAGAVTRLPVAGGPGPEEGEEKFTKERTPEAVAALTAKVRAIRPGWTTRSIRRALDDPSVLERPWPLVWRATLAVASDPQSQQPGRLPKDGPWWHAPPAKASAAESRGHEFAKGDSGWCTVCSQPEKAAPHRAWMAS